MAKFTSGEWEYAGGDNGSCEVNVGDTTIGISRWDKNTGNYVIEREEMEANARLISASPLMHEALTLFVENVERWLKTGEPADEETSKIIYEKAKMALAKANNG